MKRPHLLPKRWRRGDIADIPHRANTVPWHRGAARWWKYQAVIWITLAVVYTFIAVIGWWPLSLLMGGLIFFCGSQWQGARNTVARHLNEAWRIETESTMNVMGATGLYNPVEALEALRDGPMPPGMKREEWVEIHNEALQQLKDSGLLE